MSPNYMGKRFQYFIGCFNIYACLQFVKLWKSWLEEGVCWRYSKPNKARPAILKLSSFVFLMSVNRLILRVISCTGGLGTTFYVSYFNAVLIFGILVALNIKILYSPSSDSEVGSIEKIYDRISCLLAPGTNEDRSYMTFRSEGGYVWGFMGLCVTASLTYCDQGRLIVTYIEPTLYDIVADFLINDSGIIH